MHPQTTTRSPRSVQMQNRPLLQALRRGPEIKAKRPDPGEVPPTAPPTETTESPHVSVERHCDRADQLDAGPAAVIGVGIRERHHLAAVGNARRARRFSQVDHRAEVGGVEAGIRAIADDEAQHIACLQRLFEPEIQWIRPVLHLLGPHDLIADDVQAHPCSLRIARRQGRTRRVRGSNPLPYLGDSEGGVMLMHAGVNIS
jgi:hypothetical protein